MRRLRLLNLTVVACLLCCDARRAGCGGARAPDDAVTTTCCACWAPHTTGAPDSIIGLPVTASRATQGCVTNVEASQVCVSPRWW